MFALIYYIFPMIMCVAMYFLMQWYDKKDYTNIYYLIVSVIPLVNIAGTIVIFLSIFAVLGISFARLIISIEKSLTKRK